MNPDDSLKLAKTSDPAIWIHLPDTVGEGGEGSLAGLPFAVKDNIDVKGMPTTAACPGYRYQPEHSSTVVDRLCAEGAVPIGKTNLDQFATGLVGVRSPYGVPENPYHSKMIPGGSSSGSAVAVARGQVAFALGTDTAGSGRVPAAFNNLVGVKPSRGLVSAHGVVPACRSLDCVSIFSQSVSLARKVFQVINAADSQDAWSRKDRTQQFRLGPPTFGVPCSDQLDFSKMPGYAPLFEAAAKKMEGLGWKRVEVNLEPFLETARLLYGGPWVAERTAAIEDFLRKTPEELHPVTRGIIEGGFQQGAVDTFKSWYRLRELQDAVVPVWEGIDVLLTPTVPAHYSVEEVEADPVATNSHLGLYTNWMNLLDLCAVAIPAGWTDNGLPFGITLQSPALHDEYLMDLAEEFLGEKKPDAGPPPGWVTVAVCGAHLEGLPLNGQLTERGSVLRKRTQSAPCYRFIALPGEIAKPGMIRVPEGGASIDLELWDMPVEHFGSFVALIPPPLGIGSVQLEDGSWVKGFSCEAIAAEEAEDITAFGSWRSYLASR